MKSQKTQTPGNGHKDPPATPENPPIHSGRKPPPGWPTVAFRAAMLFFAVRFLWRASLPATQPEKAFWVNVVAGLCLASLVLWPDLVIGFTSIVYRHLRRILASVAGSIGNGDDDQGDHG